MSEERMKSNGIDSFKPLEGFPGMFAATPDGKTRISGEALDLARKERQRAETEKPTQSEPKPKKAKTKR